jgi:GTPase SAR1 family protein
MKGLRHQKGRFAFLGVEKSGKTTLLRQLLEEGYVEPVPWTSKSIYWMI